MSEAAEAGQLTSWCDCNQWQPLKQRRQPIRNKEGVCKQVPHQWEEVGCRAIEETSHDYYLGHTSQPATARPSHHDPALACPILTWVGTAPSEWGMQPPQPPRAVFLSFLIMLLTLGSHARGFIPQIPKDSTVQWIFLMPSHWASPPSVIGQNPYTLKEEGSPGPFFLLWWWLGWCRSTACLQNQLTWVGECIMWVRLKHTLGITVIFMRVIHLTHTM